MVTTLDAFYPMTGVTEQLAQWQTFAPNYYSDGMVTGGTSNNFAVTQHSAPNMSVDVLDGRCFIQGVFGSSGSTKNMTIAAADATNPRIDRVVLRLDSTAQNIGLVVITGTPAVSPSAPSIVRSATQTDYSLCQVLVGTTVTSIVTANLTDERQYASPRGAPNSLGVTASGTINPFGPTPLTDGWAHTLVTGTTTISNIAPGVLPPLGSMLLMTFNSAGCQVAAGGNIALARPFTSGGATNQSTLLLRLNGSNWEEIARGGEQAPAHQYLGNPTGTAAAATFAAIVAADLPAANSFTLSALAQGATSLTFSTSFSRFAQLGKSLLVNGLWSVTQVGSAGTNIIITVPATLAASASYAVGACMGSYNYYRGSGPQWSGGVEYLTTTSMVFLGGGGLGILGTSPSFATSTSDSFAVALTYEGA